MMMNELSISLVIARLDAIQHRLEAQELMLARITDELIRISAVAERNAVVAEKYSDRAESVFAVVDTVGTVIRNVNPLTYIPRLSLKDEPGK